MDNFDSRKASKCLTLVYDGKTCSYRSLATHEGSKKGQNCENMLKMSWAIDDWWLEIQRNKPLSWHVKSQSIELTMCDRFTKMSNIIWRAEVLGEKCCLASITQDKGWIYQKDKSDLQKKHPVKTHNLHVKWLTNFIITLIDLFEKWPKSANIASEPEACKSVWCISKFRKC